MAPFDELKLKGMGLYACLQVSATCMGVSRGSVEVMMHSWICKPKLNPTWLQLQLKPDQRLQLGCAALRERFQWSGMGHPRNADSNKHTIATLMAYDTDFRVARYGTPDTNS
eukprot:11694-Pelagomonas_calceolata.AAC.2